MTDETPVEPGTPGYKSRRMLSEENDQLRTGIADMMARLEKLESSKSDPAAALLEALNKHSETQLSARLQRELDETRKQIEDLRRPQTPNCGVPYCGWVQAKEDSWDLGGYRHGPKEGRPGEVFQVDMPDYWPGCPFTPVIITGTREDGLPKVEPHPDFQSH